MKNLFAMIGLSVFIVIAFSACSTTGVFTPLGVALDDILGTGPKPTPTKTSYNTQTRYDAGQAPHTYSETNYENGWLLFNNQTASRNQKHRKRFKVFFIKVFLSKHRETKKRYPIIEQKGWSTDEKRNRDL